MNSLQRLFVLLVGLLFAAVSCGKKSTSQSLPKKEIVAAEPKVQKFSLGGAELLKDINRISKTPSENRVESKVETEIREKCRKLTAKELTDVLDQFDLEKEYDWTLFYVFEELAGKDPGKFFDYASQLAADNGLTKSKRNLIQKAVAADRMAVEKWIKDGQIRNRGTFVRAMDTLSVLFPQDYRKQADLVLQRSAPDQQLLDQVYLEAGKYDLDQAMMHAKARLSGPELGRVQLAILFGASFEDAAAAYQMAETVDPKVMADHYGAIFGNWMQQDISGFIEALGKMPPSRVQIALDPPGRVEAVADRNPSTALEATSELVFSESTKPLFTRAAVAVAKRDYESAHAWVEGFPDSLSKNALLLELEKIPANPKR